MSPFQQFLTAVQKVKEAEKMAQPGTYDHGRYVAAALMSQWGVIRAYADSEIKLREIQTSADR